MFLVSELVEIAARALSTGVNDPMTAVTCLDWLGAGAEKFAAAAPESGLKLDPEGTPRLITKPNDFDHFVESSFGRLRDYAARDAIAALHLLDVIGEVAQACRTEKHLQALRLEVARFADAATAELKGSSAHAVRDRADFVSEALNRRSHNFVASRAATAS